MNYCTSRSRCLNGRESRKSSGSKVPKRRKKGYFEFDGSTIVLFLEPDPVEIDSLIVEYTKQGIEVKVQLAVVLGKKKHK